MLTKNTDQEPLLLLQVEYNSTKAKKRPFTQGDVYLFKMLAMTLSERLQKFAILATMTAGSVGIDGTVAFIQKIAKLESHKKLCRELEEEMIRMEGCEDCVILFNERATKQLYTIAYAEDDDFVNTQKQLIHISLNKIKKWQDGTRKHLSLIAKEHDHIKQMREDLEREKEIRSLVLNRN